MVQDITGFEALLSQSTDPIDAVSPDVAQLFDKHSAHVTWLYFQK